MAWETRKEKRLQITAKVRVRVNPAMKDAVHLEKEAIEVQLTDISTHGVGLLSQTFLPVGTVIDLEFPKAALSAVSSTLAQGSVRITGRIAYAKPKGDQCHMGLDITQIDDAARRFIQSYVSSIERRRAPRAPLP